MRVSVRRATSSHTNIQLLNPTNYKQIYKGLRVSWLFHWEMKGKKETKKTCIAASVLHK